MRKIQFMALACCLLAAPLWPDKAGKATLQLQLIKEFQGRAFVTKVRLGSYMVFYHPDFRENVARLIDTEYSPDGTIDYYVRRGVAGGRDILRPGFYIRPDAMDGVFEPRAQVWVTKVELKDDRVEFFLSRRPGGTAVADYGKLKFMLGKGYEAKAYEDLVELFAGALRIERMEQRLALQQKHRYLQRGRSAAEQQYQAATAAQPRLEAATKLREAYAALAQNRIEFAKTGRAEEDSGGLTRRTAELDSEIEGLRKVVREERTRGLRSEAEAALAEARRLDPGLKGTLRARTTAEWQNKQTLLAQHRGELAKLASSHSQLRELGAPVAEAEAAYLRQAEAAAESIEAALERERAGLHMKELDDQHRQLVRKRLGLNQAYLRAFGTPQEHSAMQALADHLRSMYENRLAAESAGSKTARAQALQLARELRKFGVTNLPQPGSVISPATISATHPPGNPEGVPAAHDPIIVVGQYSAMHYTEEHQSGVMVELWMAGGRLIGFLSVAEGLQGDTPTGLLENVRYEAGTGRLSFSAKLSTGWVDGQANSHEGRFNSQDLFEFEGTLTKARLIGTLVRRDMLHPDMKPGSDQIALTAEPLDHTVQAKTYGEWKKTAEDILKFRGPHWSVSSGR